MKITPTGQVTIPVEIREKLGLVPNSEVEFKLVGRAVRMQ
jgi:AbrB family looped-hinge helix DNA binding protein